DALPILCYSLVMLAFISDVTINKTMQSDVCVKSCDITLPCQSSRFFGFCRCLCRFHILLLVNKYMCTLSIRGSGSAICIYDSGVKVSYTPQLHKFQFS